MEALKRKIEQEGVGVGQEVVKVDMFLNHQIDVQLAIQMGQAFCEAFRDDQVDCILTVEASGIITGMTTAMAFGNIPVIFAKKGERRNIGSDVYTAEVYSFTHQKSNVIRVSRQYLRQGMRVLIIDDFLANGAALNGLISIVEQAGAVLVGAGVCIEKGWQPGGRLLREKGVKLVSLAIVDAIEDGRLIVRKDG
ncbi:MAG: xanthine phosphoribosyltransferase [Clostridia bacterium]|nr:xanthine phosphoribosyltransferase [Clostridia bacterium]